MESLVVDPRFWRGRRVLVTGHTGFKGSWLSLWLARMGASVSGFSNAVLTSPSLYEDAALGREVSTFTGDVRNLEVFRKAVKHVRPEIVVHLAAQALVRESYRNPLDTYETNVLGAANVLEACCGTAVSIVVVTSDKCYAPTKNARAYSEGDPLGGRDPYSSSKACAELITAAYRSSFRNRGTAIASARAGNVIGGGDWAADRLVPDLIRGALAERTVSIRNPRAIRPWQHVLNVLEGYLLLAQRLALDVFDEPWNFGPDSADEQSVEWVVERLSRLWDDGIATVVDDGPQPIETAALRLDSTKARTRLGWQPRWNLDEALNQVAAWTHVYRDGGNVQQVVLEQIDAHQAVAVPG